MPDEEMLMKLLQKWYQLPFKDQFPQKTKKLCCVGQADSGKSSWFAPYQGIISQTSSVMVAPDNNFLASTLPQETVCLLVDEWPPDALSADDTKRILQGKSFEIQTFRR